MRKEVRTPNAPEAIGPYSQAIETDEFVFLAGQIGINPSTGELVEGIENQTKQVMENIKAVLAALNMDFSNVVKTTIFLANMGDFSKVNEIYSSYLTPPYPARSTVAVKELPKGALVEIEVIAKK